MDFVLESSFHVFSMLCSDSDNVLKSVDFSNLKLIYESFTVETSKSEAE